MGEVLLVTINNYNLDNVKSTNTLEGINWQDVECLIFHSSIDNQLKLGIEQNKIKDNVEKVIYINKNISPFHYCVFTGLNADIYDTEEYLMDEEMLMFLINNYKQTGITIKPPSHDLETLAKSIATISSSNIDSVQKLLTNQFWIKTLNTAVSNVDTALSRSTQLNIDVAEMLDEAVKLIENVEQAHESAASELQKTRKLIDDMEKRSKPNTPFIYTTYNVPYSVQKVLYIKAVGHCTYLNSFILAYQNYLKMHRQYATKVLFIMPKLHYHMQRYKEMPRLAMDSLDFFKFDASDHYITYEPKRGIMDAFFDQPKVQIFIVVDLLFGDRLVEGHQVKTFHALSSPSDIERFNLDPKTSIYSLAGKRGHIILTPIDGYRRSNEHTRRNLYYSAKKDAFDILDAEIIDEKR